MTGYDVIDQKGSFEKYPYIWGAKCSVCDAKRIRYSGLRKPSQQLRKIEHELYKEGWRLGFGHILRCPDCVAKARREAGIELVEVFYICSGRYQNGQVAPACEHEHLTEQQAVICAEKRAKPLEWGKWGNGRLYIDILRCERSGKGYAAESRKEPAGVYYRGRYLALSNPCPHPVYEKVQGSFGEDRLCKRCGERWEGDRADWLSALLIRASAIQKVG